MQIAFHTHHKNESLGHYVKEEAGKILKDRWFWGALTIGILITGLVALMVAFPPVPTAEGSGGNFGPMTYQLM